MSASHARRSARRVSFEISANTPTRRRRPELQRGAPMFSQDRDQLRQVFIESWRKFRADEALQPLEQLIAQAIHAHPEYHALFDRPDRLLDKVYTPEMGQSNPFLHLGLHIAVQELIAADRPPGSPSMTTRASRPPSASGARTSPSKPAAR